MESFKRGFGFLKQSWHMTLVDRDLIKPSIYALLTGIIITLVGSVPVILAFVLFGDQGFGQVIGYILGIALIFVQYSVSYIFSAMTIYLIYGYLAEGDGRMDKAWAVVKRDFFDILSLAGASTLVNMLRSLVRGKGRNQGRNFLAGIIATVWTEATYLVLPAMVVEDIGLRDGLKRATQIVKDNLLLVGVSTVGVKAITGLLGFLLGGTGIALGLGVGLGLTSLTNSSTPGLVAGITLGVIIAGIFIMVAVLVSSYTTTAYHTCLYLWAREVEKASQQGQLRQAIKAPAPLAAVLN
jgi:hypothetical protein